MGQLISSLQLFRVRDAFSDQTANIKAFGCVSQKIRIILNRFAKNLDPDKIKLSALKGEVNMNNLELNEEVLMELLDFPQWLWMKSAICSHVSIKVV